MRVDFVKAMDQVMAKDPRSVFVTGDLGYAALEGIAEKYGKRFLNAGVAEQNMVGAAAGMALAGFHPWVYSIAPFATYRCLEQIRNDACLHKLPVKIVGNGGGFTYGIMGSTHHALEDLGALKAFPNIRLYFPCTNQHVASAVEQIRELATPSYLRLAISGFPNNDLPLSANPVTLTRRYGPAVSSVPAAQPLATVIGIGHATQIALTALKSGDPLLQACDLFGLARFPLDLEADHELVSSVAKTGRVVILDEHYPHGSIAESLQVALQARLDSALHFSILAAHYKPDQRYGSSAFHLKQCGLTPENLNHSLRTLQTRGTHEF